MPNLVLSISSNVLKLSVLTKKGILNHKVTVPEYICHDTNILDVSKMAEFVMETMESIIPGFRSKKSNYPLYFLAEPSDVISEFVTTKKNGGEVPEQVMHEVTGNLEGVTIEELYYSHKRIAPFVHQFTGFRKVDLEKYIELSQTLGMELRGLISWIGLLPKYVNYIEPSVIVAHEDDRTILSLSELGGVYFAKVFDKKLRSDDLNKFIKELGNYERTDIIKRVFVMGNETIKLDDPFEVTKVSIPNASSEGMLGYEKHLLLHYMLDFSPDMVLTDSNLLSLLPMPVAKPVSSVPVVIGASLAILILVGIVGFWGSKLFVTNNVNTSTLAQNNATAVLSDQTEKPESTPSVTTTSPMSTTPTEEKKLEKKDLKILIQNGAGIAGLAGRTKTLLSDFGYTVTGIGDADLVGRKNTVLKFKKEKIDFKEMVVNDIKDKYLDIVVENDLDQKENYDLLIIVGSDVKGI